MLRYGGADAFAEELDQEGIEENETGTADEWLSFCEGGFSSVARIEDLGCIGIAVRSTQGGVEVAVPSGAATPGKPDAVSVELSSEPGSYNGGSGDFVTVNLLELTGDSLDPRAARGDTCGANRIRRRRAAVIAASAAGGLSRQARAISSLCRSHRALRWKEGKLKKTALSRAPKPSAPKAARRSPATAFQELVVERLDEVSGRLSQLEVPDKGALASPSAQPAFSQNSRGSGSRSSIAGGLIVPSVLGPSAPSLSSPAACARARALIGGGANPRATSLHTHDPIPAAPVRLHTAQPDPPIEAATLGSALLRIASALEQKQDAGGTVQDAFGLNLGIANSQEDYDAIFGDQSSRESFGAARLGGQALIARVGRTRKERPEVVVAAHESRVRRDLSVLDGEARFWRRHADVCLLPRCGSFRSLKWFIAMTAAALDEGRSGSLQRQNALLHHINAVLESASQDSSHEMQWGWPILGIQDPEGPSLAPWVPQNRSRLPQKRVALDAAHKSMGASRATGSVATAPNIALIKKEIQSELDRRNAKGGKGKGGKKGA